MIPCFFFTFQLQIYVCRGVERPACRKLCDFKCLLQVCEDLSITPALNLSPALNLKFHGLRF